MFVSNKLLKYIKWYRQVKPVNIWWFHIFVNRDGCPLGGEYGLGDMMW